MPEEFEGKFMTNFEDGDIYILKQVGKAVIYLSYSNRHEIVSLHADLLKDIISWGYEVEEDYYGFWLTEEYILKAGE
jgi:hypothetical protein